MFPSWGIQQYVLITHFINNIWSSVSKYCCTSKLHEDEESTLLQIYTQYNPSRNISNFRIWDVSAAYLFINPSLDWRYVCLPLVPMETGYEHHLALKGLVNSYFWANLQYWQFCRRWNLLTSDISLFRQISHSFW